MARRRREESTSANLDAIRDWAEREAERPDVDVWVIQPDDLLRVLYTVDAKLEHVTVWQVKYMDDFSMTVAPSTRPGVTRIEFDPPLEYIAASRDTCIRLRDILAHNRLHGLLRRSGEKEGERF